MRWQFVAQITFFIRLQGLNLLMQKQNLLLHPVKALLLTKNGVIEFFDQVFREAQLGFKFI
jgi:hypothetical protein